jgi:hypothetical protein
MRDSKGSTPASSLPQKLFAKELATAGVSIVPGMLGDAQAVVFILSSGRWRRGVSR